MQFLSLQFLFFLPLIFAVHWWIPDRGSARKWALFAANALFYAAATDPIWSLYVLYIGTADWWLGREIDRTGDARRRKLLVTLSVVNGLGVLGFFKYANLIYETSANLLGWAGLAVSYQRLKLPRLLGLSYVVFKTLTYTIDIYRGTLRARKSWVDVIIYISFFPQVTAGPIMRAAEFMPQLDKPRTLDEARGAQALLRIAKGAVKKLLIADFLSGNLINRVFVSPGIYTPVEVWAAVFAYTIQIYYDFSALSDISIGIAGLFGFKVKENFDRPYKSLSLPDFWRRWHISLSTWLRDYVYIPLGGNRDSKVMTCRNVLITMILGGIWHAPSWGMGLWGLMHGLGLCMTRTFWWTFGAPEGKLPWWRDAITGVATFLSVMLARVFFRADSMASAGAVYKAMFGTGWQAPNVTPQVIAVLFLATALHFTPPHLYDRASAVFVRLPLPVRAAAFIAIALLIKQVAALDVQPFLYERF